MNLGNVLILGDSYSTFEGHIPEGNAFYYGNRADSLPLGVTEVGKTWWDILLKATNSTLLLNDSWSGSTICNTGYGGANCETSSFVGRLNKWIKQGLFEKNDVNTVLIFGGTNDWWAGSPVGEIEQNRHEKEDLFRVAPALEYLVKTLQTVAPNARIIGLVNSDFSEDFTSMLETVFKNAGVDFVTFTNIEKQNGHPNVQGMKDIAEQLLSFLEK